MGLNRAIQDLTINRVDWSRILRTPSHAALQTIIALLSGSGLYFKTILSNGVQKVNTLIILLENLVR